MFDNGIVYIWFYDKSGKFLCMYIYNFIFINLLYSNFSLSLRLCMDIIDYICLYCYMYVVINKIDDMIDV